MKDEIKKIINNISYRDSRSGMPNKAFELARDHGYTILYGASDDLLELEGSVNDEVGAWDGFSFDDMEPDDFETDTYNLLKKHQLELLWCPDDEKSWAFKIGNEEADFTTFNILEDDEVYCEGIILKD